MSVRAVSFDLDDTLWPIMPVIERAERAMHAFLERHCPDVAARHGLHDLRRLREQLAADHPHLAHDFSAMRRMTLARAMEPFGHGPELVETAYQTFFRERNLVDFFDDVGDLLPLLSGRYHLAVITNGNADLGAIGIDHYFVCSVHARDAGSPKPEPSIFETALEQLDTEAHETVHVGDSLEHDVEGAINAGMRAVWVNRKGRRRKLPAEAEEVRSLAELPDLLDRLGR